MMLPTLSRGNAGRSGRGAWRNCTRESASMTAVIVWTAFTVPSRRPMCPVTRAAQRGDRLKPSPLDLLEIDVVTPPAKELVEEERDLRLLCLEARDADECAGQVDQLSRVDVCQHGARQIIHGRYPSRAGALDSRDSSSREDSFSSSRLSPDV